MGLNLVGEAGWVDRGEDRGPADHLLGWSGWSLMPGSRALTPTDPSAMFGNLEPKGLAHREARQGLFLPEGRFWNWSRSEDKLL